ncbi:hypothetical protein Curi_c16470 [Gottschalkia acidurici 9a]|uniref:Uncharacterized protein n=1 Tax=Gottschalkia acidurici (strain ATCC 7906 / DSM 604 / BCRC 14475 / CIP 104303 / KCTC 5404 / NCIMB 10678 / 9a) TaxID=1128398 RepID=K0AZF7_GOTA9|nr:hypothetical protein [Gottschalkia acidurici]AFS78654.1 hypothetical protein Curi_c16470 [Gottschalkia acidurici 9a]
MDSTKMDDLPDYMDKKSLYSWFNNVLNYAESDKKYERVEEITDSLYELSLRQWHMYEQLDKQMKERIEMWIKEVWTYRTTDFLEGITGIIGMLGLGNIYRYIKSSLETEKNDNIREMIRYVVKELDGHEDDPYWNL